MPAFTLISSSTLASNQVSIDFTAIPQTYTHLMIFAKLKKDDTGGSRDDIRIFFDANTTHTNYRSVRSIAYDGSNLLISSDAGQGAFLATTNNFSQSVSQFGFFRFLIPNYTDSSYLKTAQAVGGYATKGTATNSGLMGLSGVKENTASNIGGITLTRASSGNFIAGSSAFLYGLSNT
jgi:hypothetical protein